MTFCERADSMWDGLYEQESTLGALLRTSDCSVRFYLYQQFKNLQMCYNDEKEVQETLQETACINRTATLAFSAVSQ